MFFTSCLTFESRLFDSFYQVRAAADVENERVKSDVAQRDEQRRLQEAMVTMLAQMTTSSFPILTSCVSTFIVG